MISAEQVALINRALADVATPAAVAERLWVDGAQCHAIAVNLPSPTDLTPAARVNFRHRRYS
jgi:hypothetical protein